MGNPATKDESRRPRRTVGDNVPCLRFRKPRSGCKPECDAFSEFMLVSKKEGKSGVNKKRPN